MRYGAPLRPSRGCIRREMSVCCGSVMARKRMKIVINQARLALLLLLSSLCVYAVSDDLSDAAQGLCDSVKSCALEQMAREDLTPEMRQMMEPMLENMCTTMQANVQQVPAGHPLYKPAVACMRSLESLSCEQMQNLDRTTTPECQKYEKLAREMGGDPVK